MNFLAFFLFLLILQANFLIKRFLIKKKTCAIIMLNSVDVSDQQPALPKEAPNKENLFGSPYKYPTSKPFSRLN